MWARVRAVIRDVIVGRETGSCGNGVHVDSTHAHINNARYCRTSAPEIESPAHKASGVMAVVKPVTCPGVEDGA